MKIFNKSEWKKVKLGDICEVVTGSTPLKKIKEYWDKNEVPFITPPELKYEGINYITPSIFVSKIGSNYGRIIPKNSICVCCIGSLGKLGILKEDSITNQQINSLILKNENVDLLYLYFYLKTIKNNLESISSSTTVKIINKSSFEKIEIILPNLEVQKKVSQKLELLENNINFRKSQLNYLNELNKSLFTTMFGDIKTNDKNWEIKKLKELVEIKSFIINKNLDSIWLLNLEDIEPNTGKLIKKREVYFKNIPSSTISFNENYILYSKLRPYLNKVFLPDDKGFGTSELVPLLPKKNIHKIFLTEYLRNDKIVDFLSQKVSGAKMPRVIMKEFQDLNLIFPPIELQNKFAERIEKIEKLKFEIEKSIEEAQKLYNSLISKYFDN